MSQIIRIRGWKTLPICAAGDKHTFLLQKLPRKVELKIEQKEFFHLMNYRWWNKVPLCRPIFLLLLLGLSHVRNKRENVFNEELHAKDNQVKPRCVELRASLPLINSGILHEVGLGKTKGCALERYHIDPWYIWDFMSQAVLMSFMVAILIPHPAWESVYTWSALVLTQQRSPLHCC